MKKVLIISVFCIMMFYIIEHSYFVARTGNILFILALLAMIVYMFMGMRHE